MAKGFSIVADIEAKATLAAITNEQQVKVLINGSGDDIETLLLYIINGVSEMVTDAKDADRKEKLYKSAEFMAELISEYGKFVTMKYSCEEVD